jgi:hypothetical protein
MKLFRRSRRYDPAALIMSLGFILGGTAQPERQITLAGAKALVRESLVHGRSKIALAPYRDPNDRNFLFFEASWNHKTGSMIAGHYAVDVHDATLWLVEGSGCTKIQTPSVVRAQRKLRRSFNAHSTNSKHSGSAKPIACKDD